MSESLLVTGCRVFLNQTEDDRLKAFASIILNNEFAICDLKIIRGNNGLFIAMPSRRRRDGTFHDVAHPIIQTLRDQIESLVLGEYQTQLAAREAGAYEPVMAATGASADFLSTLEPYEAGHDEYISNRRLRNAAN